MIQANLVIREKVKKDLDILLENDRLELDKLRKEIEKEMVEANLVIREKVKKDLDILLENDRLELDKLRAEIAEQIAIEEIKLNDIKIKNLI